MTLRGIGEKLLVVVVVFAVYWTVAFLVAVFIGRPISRLMDSLWCAVGISCPGATSLSGSDQIKNESVTLGVR